MTNEELAWAAGVFEATGTATLSRGVPMLNIKQKLVDGQPSEMVTRFHAAIGSHGTIGGPYQENPDTHPRRKPYAMWYATGHEAATVIQRLWPWLSPAKRAQWEALADQGGA